MNRKYPFKMFLLGLLLNFFIRYALLFLPGLILNIIGIWSKKCLAIGLAMWIVDLVASFVEQLRIRKAVLSESDNPDYSAHLEEEERRLAEHQEMLQRLVVYRSLRELVQDGMTLDELIDAFEKMCVHNVGEPDMLLFETGTYDFTGKKMFHFDLVRQFQFLNEDEFVQLHLTVLYEPSPKLALLRKIHWGEPEDGSFFSIVRNSRAYHAVMNLPIAQVRIDIHET